MNEYKSDYKGVKISLCQDDYPESPLEWGNVSRICIFGEWRELSSKGEVEKSYTEAIDKACYIADELRPAKSRAWFEIAERFELDYDDILSMLEKRKLIYWQTLCAYNPAYSSFSLHTGGGDRRLVGFVYSIIGKDIEPNEHVYEIQDGEVATYNDYLEGNVFSVIVEKDGDYIESLHSIYGYEYAEEVYEEYRKKYLLN